PDRLSRGAAAPANRGAHADADARAAGHRATGSAAHRGRRRELAAASSATAASPAATATAAPAPAASHGDGNAGRARVDGWCDGPDWTAGSARPDGADGTGWPHGADGPAVRHPRARTDRHRWRKRASARAHGRHEPAAAHDSTARNATTVWHADDLLRAPGARQRVEHDG